MVRKFIFPDAKRNQPTGWIPQRLAVTGKCNAIQTARNIRSGANVKNLSCAGVKLGQLANLSATEHREFLGRIGARVRNRRLEKKLSRRALSERSGVSERFIAHLELGSGNISVLKLKAIAEALDIAVTDIIGDGRDEKPKKPESEAWSLNPIAIAELFQHADAIHQRAVAEILLNTARRWQAA